MPDDTGADSAEPGQENAAPAQLEGEVELVQRYVREHFAPIDAALRELIPDAATRLVALDKATRHIFHWEEQQRQAREGPAAHDEQRVRWTEANDQDGGNGNGNGHNGHGAAAAPGGEPATPRQLAYLRDRGVRVPAGVSKSEASRLIAERIQRR